MNTQNTARDKSIIEHYSAFNDSIYAQITDTLKDATQSFTISEDSEDKAFSYDHGALSDPFVGIINGQFSVELLALDVELREFTHVALYADFDAGAIRKSVWE
tara:strand:+ start:3377 stop:3685 length:309 start_codon:yes stop_codon:yes gene_type:complete